MIPACASPHINSPNADTANMLFLGTSGLSSISDMSDRRQKLPPSSVSVLQPMVNPSGIRQIRQVTSIAPPELGNNLHRISRSCQVILLPISDSGTKGASMFKMSWKLGDASIAGGRGDSR